MLKHQVSFLGHRGHQHSDGVGGGDHALGKASTLQTPRGEFQCMKIKKITKEQFSGFVPTNFVKDCSMMP